MGSCIKRKEEKGEVELRSAASNPTHLKSSGVSQTGHKIKSIIRIPTEGMTSVSQRSTLRSYPTLQPQI
jgi:hypothetical protein